MCARGLHTGTSLIEVLVTMVIVAVGLLGLVGMQARLQASDFESYQRAQALVLLNDIASRMNVNRAAATTYVTAAPLGSGMTCPTTTSASSVQQLDAAQWCTALQGAAELLGGARAGAMLGARGCVQALPNNEYLITVAWQGMTPLAIPSAGTTCGQGLYDSGEVCIQDRCRRVVTTVVRIASLS